MAVYEAVNDAVAKARAGEGPTLVECKTYRWTSHCVGNPELRPKDEREYWLAREPIGKFFAYLKQEGIADEATFEAYQKAAEDEIESAVKFAQESPLPCAETALDDVFTV